MATLLNNVAGPNFSGTSGLISGWSAVYTSIGGTAMISYDFNYYVNTGNTNIVWGLYVDGVLKSQNNSVTIDSLKHQSANASFPVINLTAWARTIAIGLIYSSNGAVSVASSDTCNMSIIETVGANTIGLTGPTGPVGIGISSFGSTAPFFSNVSAGTGALGVLNGVAVNAVGNTALGAGAMRNLTDTANSSFNVGIGYNSLYGVTGANFNNNVAVGAYTLVGGYDNVALGNKASQNTRGGANVAIGHQALNANTVGEANVAIGWNSSYRIGNGVGNISIGYSCLDNCVTGNRTVAIGRSAGNGSISGDYNIYIGDTSTASTSSVSNEIVIGSSAGGVRGKGNNTALIYATAGLYSYTPGYWWGYGKYTVGGNIRWNTFTNRSIVLNHVNDTQILCPTPGLYEFNLSGSIFCNSASIINLNMNVNGSVYLSGPCYYTGFIGWRAISLSAFVVVTNTTTYITYTMGSGMETSIDAPTILTAKYISM
jgi:hypothetical protein